MFRQPGRPGRAWGHARKRERKEGTALGKARTYPEAYKRYLEQFHKTRDFFECHELLEEHWKEDPDGPLRDLWVGLIQLAVGLYHQRRGNVPGARKMLRGAGRLLTAERLAEAGIDGEKLLAMIGERVRELEGERPPAYRDLDLPLADESLLPLARPAADSRELPAAIIHRHKLRDRSEVVEARRAALQARRNGRR